MYIAKAKEAYIRWGFIRRMDVGFRKAIMLPERKRPREFTGSMEGTYCGRSLKEGEEHD